MMLLREWTDQPQTGENSSKIVFEEGLVSSPLRTLKTQEENQHPNKKSKLLEL